MEPTTKTGAAVQTAPAIQMTGLTRRFGHGDAKFTAVDGLDLSLRPGEIVALLGPNGAGKTTTLDMLLGLSSPDAGEVRVLGSPPRHAVSAGRIAAVLQTGGLLPDLTVAETVAVIAGLHGAKSRIAEVTAIAGLEGIAKRKVSACSGGEQQRVKFAIALIPDPDVLVLDEPTAGMDVTARRKFWEAMHREAAQGRTVLFATHYLEEAEQFAQRTVVMERGRIIADQPTTELRESLGGRLVSITLPDEASAEEQLRILSASPATGEIHREGARLHVRTSEGDRFAAALLALGGRDLEVTAPSLEAAFTSLTEETS